MDYTSIPKDKFKFAGENRKVGDKKFSTKPVTYAKDVFRRFCKNKSSVVAAIIILLILLFAIFAPIFCANNYTAAPRDPDYYNFTYFRPKNSLFSSLGFWDGGYDEKGVNDSQYKIWLALQEETGGKVFIKTYNEAYTASDGTIRHDVRIDSYIAGTTKTNGMEFEDLTESQYLDIQRWQNETGIQVIYPFVDESQYNKVNKAYIWYKADKKGAPIYNEAGEIENIYLTFGTDDNYDSIRIEGDDGSYKYAKVIGSSTSPVYRVRVYNYNYFQYKYGFEPSFLFGTNERGQDIITRLSSAARFSLIFAVCISAINLLIGAVIGALEGYYGGAFDLIVERIIDILGGVPFMVVMSLFQLHLAQKVGPIISMLFAFVLTGWIGMSARTRMQFYRFKNQEYVLSARTLGAKDGRLIFKHIFPNAIGTLITGSVLTIPGVIFSESSLTYLGIVNLDSPTMTSVGTMLANSKDALATHPYMILFPALFIALLEISFNLFGNGLRDAFNPSLKGVED